MKLLANKVTSKGSEMGFAILRSHFQLIENLFATKQKDFQ